MRFVKPSYYILDRGSSPRFDDLRKIIRAYGVCYQSDKDIANVSGWIQEKVKTGHESPLEHVSISVDIVCDRAIANELVRHRIASYSQESTRYCNYSKDKFGNELTFIQPPWYDINPELTKVFYDAMSEAEAKYFEMLENGAKPEEARAVLPLGLKTEIITTANLREWRHIFQLRAADMTGKAHPQIKEIMVPLLKEFIKMYPGVFDDILEYMIEKGE